MERCMWRGVLSCYACCTSLSLPPSPSLFLPCLRLASPSFTPHFMRVRRARRGGSVPRTPVTSSASVLRCHCWRRERTGDWCLLVSFVWTPPIYHRLKYLSEYKYGNQFIWTFDLCLCPQETDKTSPTVWSQENPLKLRILTSLYFPYWHHSPLSESFLFNILCSCSSIMIAWRFCGEIFMLSIDWWKPATLSLKNCRIISWSMNTMTTLQASKSNQGDKRCWNAP